MSPIKEIYQISPLEFEELIKARWMAHLVEAHQIVESLDAGKYAFVPIEGETKSKVEELRQDLRNATIHLMADRSDEKELFTRLVTDELNPDSHVIIFSLKRLGKRARKVNFDFSSPILTTKKL
jgi:hypothetical protein